MASRVQLQDIPLPSPRAVQRVPLRPHTLPEAASFLLDLIRFSAAILVVIAHIGHDEISTGFHDRQILGQIAVPIFFVLSGFVIRFVTRTRESTLRIFFIDRAARMYSVMLPAMALTLVISVAARQLQPQFYARYFGAFDDHPLVRILLNLSFLSQSWGHTTIPFINLPFWSLSYECLYYVGYGLIFYLRGGRRVLALGLWALAAGPQVLFLFPIWYLGCWIYDLYHAQKASRCGNLIRACSLLYLLFALLLFACGKPILFVGPAQAEATFSALTNPLTLLHLSTGRATLMAVGTGTLAALVMLPALLLSDMIRLAPRNRWVRRFRHLADGTFCIYLMHYPLMVLATALRLYRPGQRALNIGVSVVLCALLILLAKPLDRLKVSLRGGLLRLFPIRQSRGLPPRSRSIGTALR